MHYEVELLQPVVDFLRRTETKLRAKAYRTIGLLQTFGPDLAMPHARKLTGYELRELRIRQSSNICRLFYFIHGEKVIVVTSGYLKKRNSTDREEIKRALRLRDEYLAGGKK